MDTRKRDCALIVLISLLAAACSGSSYSRHQRLSEEWLHAAPTRSTRPELESQALFAGQTSLERGPLIRHVLERNPTLQAARHAWRAALSRHPQVTALDDPMLGAGVAPLSFGSDRVNDAARFDLSQRLPFPGKLRLRGEAALGEAEAAAHDHQAVRLRLATMASLLYDDYYLAARALDINAQHMALLEDFKRIATVRYEAGKAPEQAPLQAEVELTHTLHRELVLATTLRITAEQINTLLHRVPRSPLPPPPSRLAIPTLGPELAKPLTVEALAKSPELAAASARVAAQEARVDLAWREYFPDFTLTGAYNQLWQEEDLQPFVGIQLNVPLQLGRRNAAVEEAQARLEQSRSERRAIEDHVRLSIETSTDRLVEATHVVELFRERLLPAANDQVGAARFGFETGQNSFLALIDAERSLRDVELGHETALAELGRRRAEFDRSLGRIPGLGW
jgi:outer membrane protein TolC